MNKYISFEEIELNNFDVLVTSEGEYLTFVDGECYDEDCRYRAPISNYGALGYKRKKWNNVMAVLRFSSLEKVVFDLAKSYDCLIWSWNPNELERKAKL